MEDVDKHFWQGHTRWYEHESDGIWKMKERSLDLLQEDDSRDKAAD